MQNVCLFAAIVLCYRETVRAARNEWQRTILLGLLFGAGAAIGTMLPVVLAGKQAMDAGLLPIALSAVFGGPLATIITTIIAGFFRLVGHAHGYAHVTEALVASAVGIGFAFLHRRRQAPITTAALALLGLSMALAGGLGALVAHRDVAETAPVVFAVFVLGNGLGGTIILGAMLRREDAILARERAHAQESKMLDAVLESMSDGLLAVDTNGKFLVFNRPAQEMLGDWRGDKLESWLKNYKRFHLDGVTPVATEELALPRALRGLETNDLNVVVRGPSRPDGFVVSVNGRPLRDDEGNVVAGITVVRDVSELISAQKRLAESEAALKQSEERYALAFEGAYDGLWDWDLRTGKLFWSGRCMEMLGYPPDTNLSGRMQNNDWWQSLVHPDDLPATLRALQDCLSGSARSFAIEYRLRRLDGSYCWVSDRGAVIRDEDGRPYRAAGSLTDISARKLAEQHRRMLQDQLQQTQKVEALGTLAGGIAHDINNTLIPIIGAVDMLLLDAPKDSELSEELRDVMSAALKVKELVRQILAFSRDEGSERCIVDMTAEIASTLRMLRAMVPATIALDMDVRAAQLNCKINQTQIHQVIMNLVSNAVGAIGPNRGAVRVTLDQVELEDSTAITGQEVEPGSFCRISVVDTGPGISPDVKARLFDPFFTTKPVGEGTGLGLSVVQGIVRDHGGFVLVDNEPGQGARFDVHFPLVEQKPAMDAVA
ncbi:PAS domain S-box protein [Dongia deserti]|uniref:PAS domain S-box protein n=1 Tax=Dongia deserti TaxID=2268030 RepID=UPI0025488334|nr:PAS domain S-box protein [Dongia deserti]